MKRVIGLCATVVCALLAGAASGAASASPALFVDDDGVQCPNAEFTSIQAAVDAAAPGDLIIVCPGAYNEQVTVAKAALTLRAQSRTPRDCFAASLEPLDSTQEAIVTAGPLGVAFTVAADDVTISGFAIAGNMIGIDTRQEVSGFRLERNLLAQNIVGVRSGSSGVQPSRIAHNCFRDNGAGPAGGGIVALVFPAPIGPRVLNNARLDHNEFFGNNFGVRLGASTNVSVDHNASLDDDTWMRNGGTVDVRVSHNIIGAGASDGIVLFPLGGTAAGTPNLRSIVEHNTISGRGRDGIQVIGAAASLIDSLIGHNAIVDNGRDGIRIEAGANAGNEILHNRLSGNAGHDCHDDTVGSGTGGTANVWDKNHGETQNRPGLCRGAVVVAGPN